MRPEKAWDHGALCCGSRQSRGERQEGKDVGGGLETQVVQVEALLVRRAGLCAELTVHSIWGEGPLQEERKPFHLPLPLRVGVTPAYESHCW